MKETTMVETKGGRGGAGSRDVYHLELAGLAAGVERPNAIVQAVGKKRDVLATVEVGADGAFALAGDVIAKADRIVIGPMGSDGAVARDAAFVLRAREFSQFVHGGVLTVAEGIWVRWPGFRTCVSGTVRVCRRRPWWYEQLFTVATTVTARTSLQAARVIHPDVSFAPSLNELIIWPFRCEPVCLGTVEVYRRTCCCRPLVIDDLRLEDLLRHLEVQVTRFPVPPRPPEPIDPLKTPFFKGGGLNEFALNAASDLNILRSLSRDQAALYINARPYLLHRICTCSTPVKVGSGSLLPNGAFNVCWFDRKRVLGPGCSDQYAYVVKQTIGLTTTTIYDGVAAGAWYKLSDTPVLTTYDHRAYGCSDTGTTDGNAFVFLDLVGDTESHELTTPDSTAWSSVGAPGATSGLLFLNPDPMGRGHLRNLGGGVELTYNFSEGMKALGAQYYRLSVVQADASGNPTGTRHFYGTGLSWQKVIGGNIEPESLGPQTVGTQSFLYKIPYASDANWTGAGRYHALIDTTSLQLNVPVATDIASPAVNHLITLEVFDAAGQRLRPVGASDSASGPGGLPGTEVNAAFEYRRWFQPGGSVGDDTKVVPFAALTHLFCWDNRVPVADITQLVRNGVASSQECQFLVGTPGTTFGIEYRAYVPDERFQQSHGISWVRGLNGSSANGGAGSLPTPLSPSNVGKPPALAQNSGTNTFQQMLTRIDPITSAVTVMKKCTFAVTLTTLSKTTNGESFG
ncbi:MAG: hypothetical protein JNL26_01505, partial [Gemmatimonadetes bacterium]|nr:hypothetical protein [Gemmatimonadota bacterium]